MTAEQILADLKRQLDAQAAQISALQGTAGATAAEFNFDEIKPGMTKETRAAAMKAITAVLKGGA